MIIKLMTLFKKNKSFNGVGLRFSRLSLGRLNFGGLSFSRLNLGRINLPEFYFGRLCLSRISLVGWLLSNLIFSLILISPTFAIANDTLKPVKVVKVVVSFSIIEDLVKQIGKDHVKVTSLIERESEPHEFEPRAKHILIFKNADLFIYNGLNFESWADGFTKQNDSTKPRLNLGEALRLPAQDQNPHVWQDPNLVLKYIEFIKVALIQTLPEAKLDFEKNALLLSEEIRAIKTNSDLQIKKLPEPRWLIVPHNGFYHLAKAYGFSYIYLSNSDHNENLSANKLKSLIDQIKPLKSAFLFEEWNSKSPLLATLQKETQQKIAGSLLADSLTREPNRGSTIQDYLKYNTEILLKAYGQQIK